MGAHLLLCICGKVLSVSCSFVCCPACRLMAALEAKTIAFILSVVQTHPQAIALVEGLELVSEAPPQGILDYI